MKSKSYKLAKLEKNRYSIVTDKLDECYICHSFKHHLHEVFGGNNRVNSMRYGCVIPLCFHCHALLHKHGEMDLELKKELEKAFLDVYKCDINYFRSIFHINYL